jgi:hypothetical protein
MQITIDLSEDIVNQLEVFAARLNVTDRTELSKLYSLYIMHKAAKNHGKTIALIQESEDGGVAVLYRLT